MTGTKLTLRCSQLRWLSGMAFAMIDYVSSGDPLTQCNPKAFAQALFEHFSFQDPAARCMEDA